MKEKKGINKEELKDFIEKYKTDKKYKAKVQLIGYGVFILIVLIGLNISALGTSSHENISSMKNYPLNNRNTKTENKRITLLDNIKDNYEYDVKATVTTKKEEIEETKEIEYYGKSSNNNMEINKKLGNENNTYYKVDKRYYKKVNEQYEMMKEEELYDILEKEYIELDSIKEYLEKSSLDHVTEYSSGKKEYVYHMRVKEIIKSYPEIDEIEIKALEENNTLTIEIDYISLMKVISTDYQKCNVTYTYKNIGNVEDFKVIEEN